MLLPHLGSGGGVLAVPATAAVAVAQVLHGVATTAKAVNDAKGAVDDMTVAMAGKPAGPRPPSGEAPTPGPASPEVPAGGAAPESALPPELGTAPANAGELTSEQAKNLKRFESKLPVGAEPTTVRDLPGGGKAFQAEVPGRVPGSKAIYEKQIDASGETLQYTKTTVDPAGNIVHVKDKLTGTVTSP